MDTTEPITGHSLKVMRVTRRLKAWQVAAQMKVSPGRVYEVEREQFPSAEMVGRYVAALDTCVASPTSGRVA